MRSPLLVICLLVSGAVTPASAPAAAPAQEQAPQGQALVNAALANELRAAQDLTHPVRYSLRKSSPRLTTTRRIYETKDGAVARLMGTGDQPLTAADDQKELARLQDLLRDPSRQKHRKQGEDADRARALKVLRILPNAFIYTDAGAVQAATGTSLGSVEKFTFKPNPSFSPPDIETQVLTQMTGEIWVDAAAQRVVRLEGHLQDDVDFGWGLLGRLYKGGWIRIDQADLGGGQWHLVRFQMVMNARLVWKTRNFDTIEEETDFGALPATTTYQDAITQLQSERGVR